MSTDLTGLRKLPVDEKLRIVEMLWDDIAASPGEVALNEAHLAEASRRSKELKAAPSASIDRDELWRRVNG